MPTIIRCALYARVSTIDQYSENKLTELRAYVEARGWTLTCECVDDGIWGATENRPSLDELTRDARRHRLMSSPAGDPVRLAAT